LKRFVGLKIGETEASAVRQIQNQGEISKEDISIRFIGVNIDNDKRAKSPDEPHQGRYSIIDLRIVGVLAKGCD